ncbi:MAG: hypothetical protein CMM77_09765 [Rhodospirillaceae bacterium]|nr:hypothetical protein [Rhodospirillaceae bacterium]
MLELLGQPPTTLALLALAIFLGGIMKGISGIGLPIITMSIIFTFDLLPAKDTIAFVVMPILVTNLWQAMRSSGWIQTLKEHWLLIAVFLPCLFLGSRMLAGMDTRGVFLVLGCIVAAFAATNMWKPHMAALTPRTRLWAGPLAGVTGGLLGGLSTVWGPPIIMYLVMLRLPKDAWVRSVALVYVTGAVPLAAFYWSNGVLNPSNVWLSTAACIPGMAGILTGERIRRHINEEAFRRAMLVLLFLIGLNLIRRAVF